MPADCCHRCTGCKGKTRGVCCNKCLRIIVSGGNVLLERNGRHPVLFHLCNVGDVSSRGKKCISLGFGETGCHHIALVCVCQRCDVHNSLADKGSTDLGVTASPAGSNMQGDELLEFGSFAEQNQYIFSVRNHLLCFRPGNLESGHQIIY